MVELEERYEAQHRKRMLNTEEVKEEKELLPVKIGKTIKKKIVKKEKKIDSVDSVDINEDDVVQEHKGERAKKLVELYAEQLESANEKRRLLSVAANKVVENPQTELSKLKEMISILQSIDIRCNSKLWTFAVVTLCELFKDILPNYRIRVVSQVEKKQKAKKETKEIRQQEEQLLANYRHYLGHLERYLPKKLNATLKPFGVPKQAISTLCSTVVKCFGELLIEKPSFNFSQNILRLIVPLTNSGSSEISAVACEYIEKLFDIDKSQELSLEAVRRICRYIKKHKYSVRPEMVRVFLKLRIQEVDFNAPERNREEKRLRRMKFKLLSKKEQKRQKDLEKVNKKLESAGAAESSKRKLKVQTDIVEQLFGIYFFVLKSAAGGDSSCANSPMLTVALEGMARFSKFMSIDYYDDLFRIFGELLESEKLSPQQSLNCIRSAFEMMQGDGESLDVDPSRFYRHLYVILMTADFARWPADDFHALLKCLDFMLIKRRKHLSDERLFAFTKRISTSAVSCSPGSSYSLSFMTLIRNLFAIFPSLDRLLDSSPYRPGGIYRPEVEDPEHCSAEAAFLYELSLLQSSSCVPLSAFAFKFSEEYKQSAKITSEGHGSKKRKVESLINLDSYCRMSSKDIFARHSLLADLAAWEDKKDRRREKPKRSTVDKPKLASNLVDQVAISSFNPKLTPATLDNKDGKTPARNPNQWNRKARRAHRFGKAAKPT